MREFVIYTTARFGLFGLTYAVLLLVIWLLNPDQALPVLWPLIVAAVVSAIASVYLLRGMRQRFAERVQQRAERMSSRFEELRAKEDTD